MFLRCAGEEAARASEGHHPCAGWKRVQQFTVYFFFCSGENGLTQHMFLLGHVGTIPRGDKWEGALPVDPRVVTLSQAPAASAGTAPRNGDPLVFSKPKMFKLCFMFCFMQYFGSMPNII